MGLLANQKKDIVTRYGNRYSPEEWELKRQLERDEEREPTEQEKSEARAEFIATLTGAGIEQPALDKLVALGGMGILRQYENEILRFSSPEREKIVLKAANTWCRRLN